MKKFLLGFLGLSAISMVQAQDKIKDGTVSSTSTTPEARAILDLESSWRGLLIPRFSLTSTTSWPVSSTNSTNGPTTSGYLAYNTNESITGTSDYPIVLGGKGLYYWDGKGWVATKSSSSAYVEPWLNQSTAARAVSNLESIYQMGNIAIKRTKVYASTTSDSAALDVKGAVRFGDSHAGAVGANSGSIGSGNTASGAGSFSVGLNNTASGSQSIAIGNANTASGNGSLAGGFFVSSGASAIGQSAFAFGANGTSAVGNYSMAFGNNAKATALNSFAFGNGTSASNTGSLAIGNGSITTGDYAVAIGQNNKASAIYAFALGQGNEASGTGSFVGGYWSQASSLGTYAKGIASFAFGSNGTTANGDFSMAFGNNSSTGTNSAYSLAFGNGANTYFNHGIALGIGTVSPVRSGVALGRYNRYTVANYTTGTNSNNNIGDPIFQVGQGSDNGTRANLITGYYGMLSDGSFQNGWVVIGANPTTTESVRLSGSTALLTVYGDIKSTGTIYAGTNSMADYVFEDYLNGKSVLKPSYKFTSLKQVESYIRANGHLPGVTSAKEMEDQSNGGYNIDLGKLSVQTLEKTEELYLHVIEQQKTIDSQDKTISDLQKSLNTLTERLNKLENSK